MKNITIVSPKILGFSGTASYAHNVLRGLEQSGIEYDIKFLRKREISLFGKPFFGIFYQALAANLVSSSTPVVHALSPEVVTRHTNVVTIHDIIPFTQPDVYMRTLYDKIAYNVAFKKSLKVENLLVSTNYGKKQMLEHLDVKEEQLRVVNHCIDHEKYFFDPNSPFESETTNIVTMSDFNPRKRIDVAVQAMKELPEISFFHIGPTQGWKSNFERIKEIAKDSDNIHFLGPLPVEEARRYLSNADVFVYLSDEEGFGYPILEAMACGTNVLINRIPVFEELFSDVANFCDLNSFSPEDIKNAIKKKKDRKTLEDFSNKFSVERMSRDLISVYESILEHG